MLHNTLQIILYNATKMHCILAMQTAMNSFNFRIAN